MSKILVLGGTGFVGAAVVRAIRAAGHQAVPLNRARSAATETGQIIADRNDRDAMAAALNGANFDALVDTNAYTPEQTVILSELLEGTAPRRVIISSASVYTHQGASPPRESEPSGGADAWGDYGRDKSAMEAVWRASPGPGAAAIVRPPYIFGPGNALDRETWFWARQAVGAPILLPGDGRTPVQFIHVDDLAQAILRLIEVAPPGFSAFNVADPQVLTFSSLATLLAGTIAAPDRQHAVGPYTEGRGAREWFPFRDYPCLTDPSAMHALGWAPAHDLRRQFERTLLAYTRDQLVAGYRPSAVETRLASALAD